MNNIIDNNIPMNQQPESYVKKSFLALDHVFLIAMNIFDATNVDHRMDFFLSTSLLTTSLELEDSEWERILSQIENALSDLFKMNINGVAVSCRTQGSTMKLTFSDPSYHDLQLAEVMIKSAVTNLGRAV